MAKYQLLLPKMGESVAEATIIRWLKSPGDHIEADEAVMEIATDKVDSEIPSPVSGRLTEQLCNENDVVQVGAVVAVIETEASSAPANGSSTYENDYVPFEAVVDEPAKVQEPAPAQASAPQYAPEPTTAPRPGPLSE